MLIRGIDCYQGRSGINIYKHEFGNRACRARLLKDQKETYGAKTWH